MTAIAAIDGYKSSMQEKGECADERKNEINDAGNVNDTAAGRRQNRRVEVIIQNRGR